MKEFKAYPSIETVENHKEIQYFIDWLEREQLSTINFCITEKIHGSNTGFIYDPETDTVSVQSRNHILNEDEKHYNAKKIAEELSTNIKELYKRVQEYCMEKEVKQIILFGEVYGGCFPDKSVDKDPEAIKVQRGVYYSQHNQFRAFDILAMYGTEEKPSDYHFLPFTTVKAMCELCDIPLVPVLKLQCSLKEALEYPNDGKSLIYKENRLPEPTLTENRMEGVVIKPTHMNLYVGDHRFILKHKNPVFKEKCNEGIVKEKIDINGNIAFALAELVKYVTPARLENVISHFADPPKLRDLGTVVQEFYKDIAAEVEKTDNLLAKLDKEEQKAARKALNRDIVRLVKDYFYGSGPFEVKNEKI